MLSSPVRHILWYPIYISVLHLVQSCFVLVSTVVGSTEPVRCQSGRWARLGGCKSADSVQAPPPRCRLLVHLQAYASSFDPGSHYFNIPHQPIPREGYPYHFSPPPPTFRSCCDPPQFLLGSQFSKNLEQMTRDGLRNFALGICVALTCTPRSHIAM